MWEGSDVDEVEGTVCSESPAESLWEQGHAQNKNDPFSGRNTRKGRATALQECWCPGPFWGRT